MQAASSKFEKNTNAMRGVVKEVEAKEEAERPNERS